MTSPCSPVTRVDFDPVAIRAVLFDLDGTLYPQAPLRLVMASEMAWEGLRSGSFGTTRRLVRILSVFRRVREELRERGEPVDARLEDLQYSCTAASIGVEAGEIRRVVDEWVMQRPLKHLQRLVRRGLTSLLDTLAERRVQIGVLSDYPAEAKLRVMQIAPRFSLALCTADSLINAFKPHPKGFRRACDIWGVDPREVLYVGDRADTDAAGAAAAGMPCFLVASRPGGARRGSRGGLDDLGRAFSR